MRLVLSSLDTWTDEYNLTLGLLFSFYVLITKFVTLCKLNLSSGILCSVNRALLYNLFQMKPTRCTLLLSIFISTSLPVSGNYVPIIRITYCICATLVFFTLYGWLSGRLVCRPEAHPYRVKNTSVS